MHAFSDTLWIWKCFDWQSTKMLNYRRNNRLLRKFEFILADFFVQRSRTSEVLWRQDKTPKQSEVVEQHDTETNIKHFLNYYCILHCLNNIVMKFSHINSTRNKKCLKQFCNANDEMRQNVPPKFWLKLSFILIS